MVTAAILAGTEALAGAALVGYTIAAVLINLTIATILGKLLAPDIPKDARGNRGYQTTIRNPILPRRVVYGEAVLGGPYLWIDTVSNSDGTDGTYNEYLHQIVALTGHPVDDVIGIFIQDEYLHIEGEAASTGSDLDSNYFAVGGRFSNADFDDIVKVIKVNGWGFADKSHVEDETLTDSVNDRTRTAAISAESVTWKADAAAAPAATRDTTTGLWDKPGTTLFHKVTNCSYVYTRLEAVPDAWSGIPTIRYHVRGKRLYNPALDPALVAYGADSNGTHDLYDPDTWEWSDDCL